MQVDYGPIRKRELDAAARLYVDSFPRMAGPFGSRAFAFYRDLLDLMRLRDPAGFFAARADGELAGFLVLTMPGRSLFPALFREGFAARALLRFAALRYGSPFGLMRRVMKSIASGTPAGLEAYPSIYIVAMDPRRRGLGIGSALIEEARKAARDSGGLWLKVDKDNAAAIRLYERFGFTVAAEEEAQYVMFSQIYKSIATTSCTPTEGTPMRSRPPVS